MYGAGAQRTGLGVVASCDMFGNDGLQPGDYGYDPSLYYDESTGCWVQADFGGTTDGKSVDISLVPTVVNTMTPAPAQPVLYTGVSVDPTQVAQQLPTIVVHAQPEAPPSGALKVLLVGVALWGTYVFVEDYMKSRRRR